MKDRLLLLLAASLLTALAWAFWRYLGADAFAVLSAIAIVVLVADNLRLRKTRRDRSPD